MSIANVGAPLLIVLLAACVRSGSPDPGLAAPSSASQVTNENSKGIYTAEQARRGEQTARLTCFPCHSAAEWRNPGFVDISSGPNLAKVFTTIQEEMPPSDPGSLRRDQYANVLAYILRLRGVPAGDLPLPDHAKELSRKRGPSLTLPNKRKGEGEVDRQPIGRTVRQSP